MRSDRLLSIMLLLHTHGQLTADESRALLILLSGQPADAHAKSRHKKPENVRRYFHPSAEAIAEVTSLLAPGDSRL